MPIWIGTSGYSYPDWVGPFYPEGTRPERMLASYCRHFPLVELNFTYYRPPTAEQLARVADQTPAGFQFLVKLPRTLTHEREFGDLPGFRRAVEQLHRRQKLMGLLCQLPQACHDGPSARDWIARLGDGLGGLGLAVEFRHRSWARDDVPGWLGARGLDLVSVDVPNLPGLYPRGLVRSGSRLYLRFHSRNADNWYRSDKERYDYDYSDEELEEWVDLLERSPADAEWVLMVLFNNCRGGQAVRNARRLRERLRRRLPQQQVIAPFAAPVEDVRQRSLFD